MVVEEEMLVCCEEVRAVPTGWETAVEQMEVATMEGNLVMHRRTPWRRLTADGGLKGGGYAGGAAGGGGCAGGGGGLGGVAGSPSAVTAGHAVEGTVAAEAVSMETEVAVWVETLAADLSVEGGTVRRQHWWVRWWWRWLWRDWTWWWWRRRVRVYLAAAVVEVMAVATATARLVEAVKEVGDDLAEARVRGATETVGVAEMVRVYRDEVAVEAEDSTARVKLAAAVGGVRGG